MNKLDAELETSIFSLTRARYYNDVFFMPDKRKKYDPKFSDGYILIPTSELPIVYAQLQICDTHTFCVHIKISDEPMLHNYEGHCLLYITTYEAICILSDEQITKLGIDVTVKSVMTEDMLYHIVNTLSPVPVGV